MMSRKSMIKFIMFVMMKLIILMIFKVHAHENTSLSPAPTTLPTRLHLFQLDNDDMSYIDRCIESTLAKSTQSFYIAKHLLECLFKDPMHPKDYPISFFEAWMRFLRYCILTEKLIAIHHADCIAERYRAKLKKH
jgi:hypothetical protein